MIDRDLGQQQSATAVLTNKKTVASDFDFVGLNGLRRGENAQLHFQKRCLLCCDGREAIIVEGSRPRGFRYSTIDRANRQHVADASAQLTAEVERSENPAGLGKVRRRWIQTNLSLLKRRRNGIVREAEQHHPLFGRELLAGKFLADMSCAALGSAWL